MWLFLFVPCFLVLYAMIAGDPNCTIGGVLVFLLLLALGGAFLFGLFIKAVTP